VGTGLKPNRMPSEWEKRPLPMSGAQADGPQGVATGWYGKETRSLAPGHAQAPIPSPVSDVIAQPPGSLIDQLVLGRPGQTQRKAEPGNDDNNSTTPGGKTGGLPGPNTGLSRAPKSGSSSKHVTKGTF
jgi:hypothetical protein